MKLTSLPNIVLFTAVALAPVCLSSCALFKPADTYSEPAIGGRIYYAPNSSVPRSNRYLGYSTTLR
ncbi:MAG: hypothetical protein AAF585_24210 [Verrucomicrobiota bacterium]